MTEFPRARLTRGGIANVYPSDDPVDSDTACKCGHEPAAHYYKWGYCWCDECDCWLFREQFQWDDRYEMRYGRKGYLNG